jgi:hypothetical protein
MRKFVIALAAGTVIGLAPMFAEQAEAQRFGRGGGGIGRVGGVGGIGRVGGVGGIGRVGVGPRVAGVGWGRPGVGWGGPGVGWGRPGTGWAGRPWVGRAGWGGWGWGAPLAVGIGVGVAASCWRWDPYYGQYVNACAVPGYGYGYYGGQWW